jgi:hypothetical protein
MLARPSKSSKPAFFRLAACEGRSASRTIDYASKASFPRAFASEVHEWESD